MRVRLFGEVRVDISGAPVTIRGVKQRTLLAVLALAPRQAVGADRLIDVLWRDGAVAHPGNACRRRSVRCGGCWVPMRYGLLLPPATRSMSSPTMWTSSGSSGW